MPGDPLIMPACLSQQLCFFCPSPGSKNQGYSNRDDLPTFTQRGLGAAGGKSLLHLALKLGIARGDPIEHLQKKSEVSGPGA